MVEHGWKVIPLGKKDKRPIWDEWPKKGVSTPKIVYGLAAKYPLHNYGMFRDDAAVLDIDLDKDTNSTLDSELAKLSNLLGHFEPRFMQKTGGGGYHIPFYTHGRKIHSQQLTNVSEIKGWHSQIVGAGSTHPETGRRYHVHNGKDPSDLTELSENALDFLSRSNAEYERQRIELSKPAAQHEALPKECPTAISADDDTALCNPNAIQRRIAGGALDYEKPIPAGARNVTLFRIGCYYREVHALQTNDIFQILKGINENDCEVPLDNSELVTIAKSCCTYPPGTPRDVSILSPTSEPRSEEVQDLFKENRLIELFRKNVQKFHVGDWNVAELLLLSLASMSVENTNGIQPKLSGESGKGKTHVVRAVLHLMHPSTFRAASFSSKALFYDDTLLPKTVLFSDDVNLVPDVEETVRAAMTNWDSPTQHVTLDSQRKPITLSLPPRAVFWLTSVSTKSTIQLLNRQVEINVDESPEQDKLVEQHQRRLAESGLPDFYEDAEVTLLRQASLHLNKLNFRVKIPFVERIRFSEVQNRRNLPIFLDLIRAYSILNFKARCVDEKEALVAAKEDFDTAFELFKTIAVQQVTKLSKKERLVADIVQENTPCDIPTIMDETGLSNTYVYELLHGDRKSENRGMLEKIPELKFYSRREIDPDTGYPWGRNHYALPPDWKRVSSSESVLSWDDAPNDDDQLRTVSDSFGDEFRNSENDAEVSDFHLDDENIGNVGTANINFGTSEENAENFASSLSPAAQRSPEIGCHAPYSNPLRPLNAREDAQNSDYSVSLHLSEMKRNSSDVDAVVWAPQDPNYLDEANSRSSDAKAVKFTKVRVLRDIPQFVGVDGKDYALKRGDKKWIPEPNAKVLLNRGLAVYGED
ncbi:MAG: bifunctional DNA primase/polymerase [Halobacteriota archaeon]